MIEIRESVAFWSSGTQTSPPTTSRLTGREPTFTTATTRRVFASIRETDALDRGALAELPLLLAGFVDGEWRE